MSESTKPRPSHKRGEKVYEIESLTKCYQNHLIIRSAGQYGKGRDLSQKVAGKDLGKDGYINLIEKNDLLNIIDLALNETKIKLINAVNIHHPRKKDFYSSLTQRNRLPRPHFSVKGMPEDKKVFTEHKKYLISHPL